MPKDQFTNVVEEVRDGKSKALGSESVILKPTCTLQSPESLHKTISGGGVGVGGGARGHVCY